MKVFATCALALLAATHVDALACNYEGTLYPVCMKANAWSYENGRVCVGITRCVSQSPPYGITFQTVYPLQVQLVQHLHLPQYLIHLPQHLDQL